MQIARVKGTVVSTNKAEKLMGLKLLVVKPIDLETMEEKGSPIVAVDAVGAGEGEVVMLVAEAPPVRPRPRRTSRWTSPLWPSSTILTLTTSGCSRSFSKQQFSPN